MKLLLILLGIVVMNTIPVPWDADFAQLSTQFESFQATPAKGKIIDEDGAKVLHYEPFTDTKYAGIITKDWISSPSGQYWITVEFKGTLNKRTGAFVGYTRSDRENIVSPIGLDYDKNFYFDQIYELKPYNGEWRTYKAHLVFPNIGTAASPAFPSVKIILERGQFFGAELSKDGDAKFRNLKVRELVFTCPPATPDVNQMQLSYLGFLFENRNIQYRVLPQAPVAAQSASSGQFKFEYPSIFNSIKCLKTDFYGLDKDGKVIEKFDVKKTEVTDLQASSPEIRTSFTYDFTMNQIETLGCPSEIVDYKDNKNWTKYTCNYEQHFWYDTASKTFTTKQASFEHTKSNSQAIFKSNFFVYVYKQETTELKLMIRTLVIDNPCQGVCEMDMSLKLELSVRPKGSSTYVVPSTTAMTVTWTDYLSFKITSAPLDYNLELLKIFVTTEGEQAIELGDLFITSFIQNKKTSTKGELTFDMMMSGEAGLQKGKKFNMMFLTKSTAAPGRFLQTSGTVKAQITGSAEFPGPVVFAGKLTCGLFMLLLLLFLL